MLKDSFDAVSAKSTRPANIIKLEEPPVAPGSENVTGEEALQLPDRNEWTPYDGNTAFLLYIREVGQTKLLTPEEELKLAARVKKGDKKAREQMIKANLRLVVKIARSYEIGR